MQKNVPKLRFREFKDEWDTNLFGDIAFLRKETFNPLINKQKYNDIELESIQSNSGKLIKTIDSNTQISLKNKFYSGDILYGKLRPYLRKFLLANFDGVCSSEFWILRSQKNFSNLYLYYLIQTKRFDRAINIQSGSKMPRADWNIVSSSKFVATRDLSEQQEIASFLLKVDEWIENLRKQKEEWEKYKKGMMQKIFSQKIRFKNIDGNNFPDWGNRKLNEILIEHKLKSTGKEDVFSVSVHKGLINQIEHLGRSYSAKNTENYNLVKPFDIIYTKSPTGKFPLGIIKQSRVNKDVIVSPLYGVFTPETSDLGYMLNDYFESPINTQNYLSSIVLKGAKNTINITNNIFLSKNLLLPVSKQEQKKVAEFLTSLDKVIESKQKQIDLAENWKKGLMQRMFV